MLQSWRIARDVNGPSYPAIATECGNSPRTVKNWATGHTRCPVHKRQSVERALGATVDWAGYDLEFDALHREKADTGAEVPLSPAHAPSQTQHSKQPAPETTPAPTKTRAQRDNDELAEMYGL